MLTLGIDEAGRGPVLGPMVLAGVLLSPRAASALTRAGVTDSKRFVGPTAHAARSQLIPRILAHATAVHVRVAGVEEVDAHASRGELNVLERAIAREILTRIGGSATRVLCDGARLFGPLCAEHPHLRALDRAEDAHAAVAAASLLAKVRRDELFACIVARYRKRFGLLTGGGYVNAPTMRFLAAHLDTHGRLPPETRSSWRIHAQPAVPRDHRRWQPGQ